MYVRIEKTLILCYNYVKFRQVLSLNIFLGSDTVKFIISKHPGAYLSLERALKLCELLTQDGVTCIEHRSEYAFDTPQLAEKANLNAMMEAHKDLIFIYAGTEHSSLGHKVLLIGIKQLPPHFEEKYPNFQVVGY